MNILVFDTETNDQAKNFKLKAEEDLNNYPYIVQLSAKLIKVDIDEDKWLVAHTKDKSVTVTELFILDNLISPYRDGNIIEISNGAYDVHGISVNDCINEGFDITERLILFQGMLSMADVIIAHNINFDRNVIVSEFLRLGLKPLIRKKSIVWCSMLNTMYVCNLKGKIPGQPKWPTLSELYKHLFNIELGTIHKAHDAMGDVNATVDCVVELLKREITLFQTNKRE